MPRTLATVFVLLSMLVLACSAGAPSPTATALDAGVPSCDDLPVVSAPEAAYGDDPIYVGNEMPAEEVQEWAAGKPGFEVLWIDREHHGWVNVAFSRDAAARQAELDAEFPDDGVVAVEVDWTMAALEALQQQVHRELAALFPVSSGILVTKGVVEIGVGALTADRVAAVHERFAGERVCISGFDPALAPAPGPQLAEGDGWRLLGSEEGAGQPYRTGIAFDAESYRALWADAGLSVDAPEVDFENEVAIWLGAVFGSSCPGLRLDGVMFDLERSIVHATIVDPDPEMACTADANPHAFVVAVPRARLPAGPFAIQLNADGPPGGVPEERTIVEVDLSTPGAVAEPDAVHPDTTVRRPEPEGPGGFVEPGFPSAFRMSVHCGIEWLGPLNDVTWRAEVPAGAGDVVPDQWAPLVTGDGMLDLTILMEEDPAPRLTATANGHSVTYVATTQEPPGCD
ncbi:MAG TPA: hypothetical protein VLA44_06155 [Clostridia bacterium]|nr:hypothetical protein [Clostridia bacterium]